MKKRYIKTSSQNYFIDTISGERSLIYDPDNDNMDFVMNMDDGSILQVNHSNISYKYNNIIEFIYNDTLYTIDDGYRDTLIKAGYLVYKDFDTHQELDKEKGYARRNSIAEMIFNALKQFDVKIISHIENNIAVEFEEKGFRFTVYIDTINNIVSKNQDRMANDVSFMPFNKGIDKYSCFYIGIFAKKLEKVENGNVKYKIANEFVKKFINTINENEYHYEFHYDSLQVKYRIPRIKEA